MHLFLSSIAVLFLVLGLTGFAAGQTPVILWSLAALSFLAAWRSRVHWHERHEDRPFGPHARE